MSYTPASYTGNGATTDRVFTFPYFAEAHVKVSLDGVEQESGVELISVSTVRITPAPASGVAILIYRVTPGDPVVTWADGAVILGRHLNASAKQSLYISEESRNFNETLESLVADHAENAAEDADDAAAAATAAAASANAAATAADNAAASVTAAAAAFDNFEDRYLGEKATDPTLDNDGNALLVGALYFNTAINKTKVYNGTVWGIAFNDVGTTSALTNDSAVSGATAKDALETLNTGLGTKLASASYTAADVLAKLLTVDGNTSGVDADKWKGATFTVSTSAPSGGADGDFWFERVA